jgi:hypothetical protein
MTSPAKNFENALRCYKNFVCEGGGYDKDFFERNRFNLALINAMRRLTQGFVEYKAQWTLWKNAKKEKQDLLLHNARLRREINKLDENGLVSLYTITQKAKAIQAAIDTIKVAIDRYNTQFGPILEQLSTEKDNINAVAVSLTESIPEIQTTYVETERVDTICPVNGQPLTCYKYETKLKATSFSQVERADIGLGNTTLDKIDVPVFNSPVVVVDRCA